MPNRQFEPSKEGPKLELGLKGLIVAETNLSFIDGDKGHLLYKGYAIEDLAEHATFEEVSYLFLKGSPPNKAELADPLPPRSRSQDKPHDLNPQSRLRPRPKLDFIYH